VLAINVGHDVAHLHAHFLAPEKTLGNRVKAVRLLRVERRGAGVMLRAAEAVSRKAFLGNRPIWILEIRLVTNKELEPAHVVRSKNDFHFNFGSCPVCLHDVSSCVL